MRLPTQKRLLKEDLKDFPTGSVSMIDTINSFFENVYQCLNRNVTFQDNVASFIYTLTYTTPSTYPAGVEMVEFANQLKTKPIGVLVLQAYDKSNYVAAIGPVYIPWVEVNNSINVGTITGLEASKSYLVRLAIF